MSREGLVHSSPLVLPTQRTARFVALRAYRCEFAQPTNTAPPSALSLGAVNSSEGEVRLGLVSLWNELTSDPSVALTANICAAVPPAHVPQRWAGGAQPENLASKRHGLTKAGHAVVLARRVDQVSVGADLRRQRDWSTAPSV